MSSIMGPIGPEQLQLFALELGEIAAFDFVYSLPSTNIYQSATNLVTIYNYEHKIFDEFDYGSSLVQITVPKGDVTFRLVASGVQ